MSSIKYRADIDGLRAVAVLAVIVFHAAPAWLPGAFIGVDMFFVISGYLIGGIIYKAHRDGTFSYADFYSRRVRRIFPALLVMLGLCLLYGWLVLLPTEFEQLGGHAAAGTAFLQNVAFWKESGYFDTDASLKPLLHLWSLAVEEQMYLVFPPLVVFVLWMRWRMLPVLSLLLVASFAANLSTAGSSVSAGFFLTPFRAWELLAGAILAWIHDRRVPNDERTWKAEAVSWAGVGLLAGGLAWIDDRGAYPGWRAVVPVVGTLLVISAGRNASFNRLALSLAPVVWVGLISYPLYLFHWPLISFVRIIRGDTPGPALIAAAVTLAFVLAVATYHGVEKRIRHGRWKWTVPALLAAFVAVGVAGAGIWKGLIPPRPVSPDVRMVDEAIAEARKPGYSRGFTSTMVRGILVCKTGGSGPRTMFLGDSFMLMHCPRVHELLRGNTGGMRGATFVTLGGACPIPDVHREDRPELSNLIPVFEEEMSADPAVDRVVIAARWPLYFVSAGSTYTIASEPFSSAEGRAAALRAFGTMIGTWVGAGKHVTVLLTLPEAPALGPEEMLFRGFLSGRTVRARPLAEAEVARLFGSLSADIAAVASAHGAEVIDPLPFLCRDGTCIAMNGQGPIRSDNGHLRYGYVRDHVAYLDHTVAETKMGVTASGRDYRDRLTQSGFDVTVIRAADLLDAAGIVRYGLGNRCGGEIHVGTKRRA